MPKKKLTREDLARILSDLVRSRSEISEDLIARLEVLNGALYGGALSPAVIDQIADCALSVLWQVLEARWQALPEKERAA